jgi:hypothetical protein
VIHRDIGIMPDRIAPRGRPQRRRNVLRYATHATCRCKRSGHDQAQNKLLSRTSFQNYSLELFQRTNSTPITSSEQQKKVLICWFGKEILPSPTRRILAHHYRSRFSSPDRPSDPSSRIRIALPVWQKSCPLNQLRSLRSLAKTPSISDLPAGPSQIQIPIPLPP